MVGNSGIVDNLLGMNRQGKPLLERQQRSDGLRQIGQHGSHIACQETAVRARIGRQLLLIKRLRAIECLLGGVAEKLIGFALERGQVVELRRMIRPCFLFNPDNLCGLPVAGIGECLRFLFVLEAFACRFAGAEQMNGIKRLGRKAGNGFFALDDHRQRRGHHAPDGKRRAIEQRIQARQVNAHQPVRLGAAERRFGQKVIFCRILQVRHSLADSAFFQRRSPEALDGLAAMAVVVNQTENQLALASGIRRADDGFDIRAVHQGVQQLKLLFRLFIGDVLPRVGQNRQICAPPTRQPKVIVFRLRQRNQMTDAPGNQIAVSFEIAVFAIGCADDSGNRQRDARLLGDNKRRVQQTPPFTFRSQRKSGRFPGRLLFMMPRRFCGKAVSMRHVHHQPLKRTVRKISHWSSSSSSSSSSRSG